MSVRNAAPRVARASGTRDRQREETRQRLYDAALQVFRRDGVQSARIDDIVALAGVSHGAFYFHFATKEDVLRHCLRLSEQRVVAAIDALPQDVSIRTVIAVLCERVAAEWQEDRDLFPEVGAVALRTVSTRAPTADEILTRIVVANRFRGAAERGELRRELPAEVLSDVLLIHVFAAALAWCQNPVMALGDVLSVVTNLFLNGAGTGNDVAAEPHSPS